MAVPVAIYLAFNAGEPGGARLGRRDVDRHGVRARHARARRAALPRPAARVPAHRRRRRRHRRAARDRDRLHRATSRSAPCSSRSASSPFCSSCAALRRPAAASSTRALGVAAWVALLQVGRRPGRRRARDGAAHLRVPGAARADLERATERFRAFREQPTPELARSARRGRALGDLAERAAAAALPPVDELRDRAALRARERRHRDRRRPSLARAFTLADHARDRASATSSASRVGIVGVSWLAHAAQRAAGCARRSAGPRSPAAARSPASGSPSRC